MATVFYRICFWRLRSYQAFSRHSLGIALKGRALLYRDKLRILVNCDLLCAPKVEVCEENDQNYFSLPAFVDQLCLCAGRVGGREGTRDRV